VGCAGFLDDVTSHSFTFKSLWVSPDPLVVLRESSDGTQRAKALRSLQEPKQHGGTEQEQDAVVNLLVTAVETEKQPLCRLAAIEALGHFKDPRAVPAIVKAFDSAGTFPPDSATVIRCQALRALGETQSPAAVERLVAVVREPRVDDKQPLADKRQALDVRIAAARALGNFNETQATAALVDVMRTGKDVALRDTAQQSLEQATGKDLPADAKAWEDYFERERSTATASADKPGILKLLSFSGKP
jgi:HEAT repeat protein